MPKQKTHSGLKKRVKKTASGKIKRGCAFRSHLKSSKTQKQIRQLRKGSLVSHSDEKRIKQLIANL